MYESFPPGAEESPSSGRMSGVPETDKEDDDIIWTDEEDAIRGFERGMVACSTPVQSSTPAKVCSKLCFFFSFFFPFQFFLQLFLLPLPSRSGFFVLWLTISRRQMNIHEQLDIRTRKISSSLYFRVYTHNHLHK